MQDGKTGRLVFGPPSGEEEQQIRNGLAIYLADKVIKQLLKGKHLLIGKGRRLEVFLVSKALWDLHLKVQPQHPYFIGLFLGELKDGVLHPSLHSLHRLADGAKPSAKVVASSKGEQRFLYGRDLELQEFQDKGSDSETSKKVLVVNVQADGLGFGQIVKNPAGDMILKNRLDLGWYLRRGR